MTNKSFIGKNCPCGKKKKYESCCQPMIEGKSKTKTVEELLRSRYTAFVIGDADYILGTHHPDTRSQISRDSIIDWASNSVWHGLEIISQELGTDQDSKGEIEFIARYTQTDPKTGQPQDVDHKERSEFRKLDDVWYFYDVAKQRPIKHETPQTGRNDPCPCGSGKKFKKCCAA